MRRTKHRFTDRAVKAITKAGRHGDGGGLYLNVAKGGSKAWVLLYTIAGKRREMGLGSYPATSLAEARGKAEEAHRLIKAGNDPLKAQRALTGRLTAFGPFADSWFNDRRSTFRNARHRAQWEKTFAGYCMSLRPLSLADIGTADVLTVLKPLWKRTPETAARVRGRIERVLAAAKAQGLRTGENPAQWRGHLDAILPSRAKLTRGHHKALAYRDMPAFIARLKEQKGLSATALEICILTATRTREALGMRWRELELEHGVWTIPAERMKAGIAHRVPLSRPVIALLSSILRLDGEGHVFPGLRYGRPLSDTALLALLRRMRVDATVHGFRSAFRDWAAEQTSFPHTTAEHALAHRISDKAEAAYRRGDELERRRQLMEAWAQWCEPRVTDNVVSLARA